MENHITKPSYEMLKNALKKIAYSQNADFRNWKQRGDKMQSIAQRALIGRLNEKE